MLVRGEWSLVILLKNSQFLEKTARNFNICVTIFAKKSIFQQNHWLLLIAHCSFLIAHCSLFIAHWPNHQCTNFRKS